MLSLFRRGGAAQILGGAIVFAIIIVFVISFRPGQQSSGASLARECAIQVYDQCLEEKEFLAAYRLMAPPGAEPKALRQMGLRAHVVNGLVERELLLREAERLGIAISEEEIDSELTRGRAHVSLPIAHAEMLGPRLGLCGRGRFGQVCEPGGDVGIRLLRVRNTKTKKFDYKKYERVVRVTTNRGAREFKEMQRRELVAERMRKLVATRARVSEAEAYLAWERMNSKAVIRTVQVVRDWFGKYVTDASDSAVNTWSLANQEQVDEAWKREKENFGAGCPLVSEILVALPPGARQQDEVTLRDKAANILARIEGGDDFGQLARELSEGRTAIIGGALGCLTEKYGLGGKELVSAIKDVSPGNVSGIIETKLGFHLLKLHGLLAEDEIEQIGRRHLARVLAVSFKADELAKEFATELVKRAQAGEELEAATARLAREFAARHQPGEPKGKQQRELPSLDAPDCPKVEVSAPFAATTNPIPTAATAENPAATAFALKQPGDLHPTPLVTAQGVAVIQLKEKMPAKRADFEQEKASMVARLRQAKARAAVNAYVTRLRNAANEKIQTVAGLAEETKEQQDT
jgi:peptidyl-prolyl cis-trans isomerase D